MEEEEIKARFTEEIKALSVSKNSIAEKIGFSAQTFTNISSGRNLPGILLISRIKKFFPSFDINYVITGNREGVDSATMEELERVKGELQRREAIITGLLGKSKGVNISPGVVKARQRRMDMKKATNNARHPERKFCQNYLFTSKERNTFTYGSAKIRFVYQVDTPKGPYFPIVWIPFIDRT